MASSKSDYLSLLTEFFPWLSEELAMVVVQRLTERDLKKLREELSEAELVSRRKFAKDVLKAGPANQHTILTAYADVAP